MAVSMYPAINHDRERLRICLLNIPGHKDIGSTLFRATSVPSMNDTNGTLGRMASDIKRKIDRTTNVQAKNNLKDELASIEGRMYQFEPREIKNAGRLSLKGNKVDTQKWLKLFKSEKETGFDGIID